MLPPHGKWPGSAAQRSLCPPHLKLVTFDCIAHFRRSGCERQRRPASCRWADGAGQGMSLAMPLAAAVAHPAGRMLLLLQRLRVALLHAVPCHAMPCHATPRPCDAALPGRRRLAQSAGGCSASSSIGRSRRRSASRPSRATGEALLPSRVKLRAGWTEEATVQLHASPQSCRPPAACRGRPHLRANAIAAPASSRRPPHCAALCPSPQRGHGHPAPAGRLHRRAVCLGDRERGGARGHAGGSALGGCCRRWESCCCPAMRPCLPACCRACVPTGLTRHE